MVNERNRVGVIRLEAFDSSVTIDENVPANSVVGIFSTTDPDSGDSFTYTLVSGEGGNDNDLFTIDGETLSLDISPDLETQDSYRIRVQTEDSGGETFTETFDINIEENLVPEISPLEPVTLLETADNGTEVFTVEASDPDGDNQAISFELTAGNEDVDGNGTAAFAIDNNGLVTVQDTGDLGGNNTFDLEITATDSEGVISNPETVSVEIQDNQPPEITGTTEEPPSSILETTATGTSLFTVEATEPEEDDFTFSFADENLTAFAIDEQTGEVTLAEAVEGEQSFNLDVVATDEFGEASDAVSFPLDIEPNLAPELTQDSFTFSLSEAGNAENGQVLATIEASDPEENAISFGFAEESSAFAIDAQTGEVTVAATEELELGEFNFTVEATDEFDNTSEGNLTINVDSPVPEITSLEESVSILESATSDTEVFTVEASDPDGDDEAITFELIEGNSDLDEDGTPAFAINDEGVVTVQDIDDLEAGTTFDLEIVTTDDQGAESDAVTFGVEVGEAEGAQPPSVTANINDIGENQPAGTFVGQVSVVDPDGETEEFEFELVGNNLDIDGDGENVFAINADGEITVNDTDDLNFEQQESFTFNVTAIEVGVTDPLTNQTEVTVGVVEVQEEERSSDFNNDGFVNLDDLGVFASAFGSQQGEDNFNPIADLTGDGFINLDDLGIFASEFG